MPEIKNSENETVNEKQINFSIDLFGGLFDTELDLINNDNMYSQLDVFDNLLDLILKIIMINYHQKTKTINII